MSDLRIGEVTIVIQNRQKSAMAVNDILNQYGDSIIARMGVPHRSRDICIISVVLEASTDEIGALTGKIGQLEDVKVKSITI